MSLKDATKELRASWTPEIVPHLEVRGSLASLVAPKKIEYSYEENAKGGVLRKEEEGFRVVCRCNLARTMRRRRGAPHCGSTSPWLQGTHMIPSWTGLRSTIVYNTTLHHTLQSTINLRTKTTGQTPLIGDFSRKRRAGSQRNIKLNLQINHFQLK